VHWVANYFWLKIPNATYLTDKKMPPFQQCHLK